MRKNCKFILKERFRRDAEILAHGLNQAPFRVRVRSGTASNALKSKSGAHIADNSAFGLRLVNHHWHSGPNMGFNPLVKGITSLRKTAATSKVCLFIAVEIVIHPFLPTFWAHNNDPYFSQMISSIFPVPLCALSVSEPNFNM